jgi:hypothetical protein
MALVFVLEDLPRDIIHYLGNTQHTQQFANPPSFNLNWLSLYRQTYNCKQTRGKPNFIYFKSDVGIPEKLKLCIDLSSVIRTHYVLLCCQGFIFMCAATDAGTSTMLSHSVLSMYTWLWGDSISAHTVFHIFQFVWNLSPTFLSTYQSKLHIFTIKCRTCQSPVCVLHNINFFTGSEIMPATLNELLCS